MKSNHLAVFIAACLVVGGGIGAVLAFYVPVKREPATVSVVEAQSVPVQPSESETVSPAASASEASSVTAPSEAAKAAPVVKKIPVPVAPCPVPTNSKDNPNLWLAPVGPDYSIGSYIPSDLVLLNRYVETTTSTICLTQTAAIALQGMEKVMRSLNLDPIVASGFRDSNYQEYLYEGTNVVSNGYSSVALPGHSEHQLGYTVDFESGPDGTGTDYYSLDMFKDTASYAWMVQNAWKYGFIQSYQVGDESITGYIAEPWHWRYVGIANAAAIHAENTTTYQYLQNLSQH